jgi:hypothetical protein
MEADGSTWNCHWEEYVILHMCEKSRGALSLPSNACNRILTKREHTGRKEKDVSNAEEAYADIHWPKAASLPHHESEANLRPQPAIKAGSMTVL